MVVTRDGKIIYTVDNPAPGASMSFVDENVPCYSTFEYRVYAVLNGVNGAAGVASESFGPTCGWTIVATTTNMTGWKSAYIISYDGAGREIDRFTMTNSTPTTYIMNVTIGKVSFAWKAGSDNVQISFKIKDTDGNIVYEYSGTTNNIQEGLLYETNNGCGNPAPTAVPTNLTAYHDGANIYLTWEGSAKSNYGFNIYRDGVLFGLAHTNQYLDEAPSIGGHCYQVCVLGDGGESAMSNEACGTAGDGCDPARNEWYYYQANGKPTITWYPPEHTDGLSAYFIFRKINDGDYERIKILGPDKTEYKETRAFESGNWYYYRVVAFYEDIDCYSSPARSTYGNEYYVKIYGSPEGVDEVDSQAVQVYPNPAKDMLTVKAENLSSVTVYNMMGQKVLSQAVNAEEITINTCDFESGIYMVRVVADGIEITRKISVIK